MTTPIRLEVFSCAGGMAEGFRRAGIVFDMAVDMAPDHVASYEANLGHRPITMDARDLLRMVKLGWSVKVDLLVCDPPCTPWSRAGKRKGTLDERDMLEETAELIRLLRPRRYLIGNVPGLDDQPNWHIVQKVIGSLEREGYCVADFAALDAANYGVPQRRIRPFWFGHLEGPCIQWPAPTHADPAELRTMTLPGFEPLKPWVTCKQALGHLPPHELGRPVRLRKRSQHGKEHGSVKSKPAKVVGTSNLSDGNVLVSEHVEPARGSRKTGPSGKPSGGRREATYAGGYTPSSPDAPARTVVKNTHGDGTVMMLPRHPGSDLDQPAPPSAPVTVRGSKRTLTLNKKHPPAVQDAPAPTLGARQRGGQGGHVLVDGGPTAKAKKKRREGLPGSVPMGDRTGDPDRPAATLCTTSASRQGGGAATTMAWPWDRPSVTVQGNERIPPPGHHDENFAVMSLPGAVLLSEKAATILQGFPESWTFVGKTKKARWSQLGQAMPPPLAHAVASAVVDQERRTYEMRADARIDELMAKGDHIGALCHLVKEAGGTMRLYGQPVDAAGLRAHAEGIVDGMARSLTTGRAANTPVDTTTLYGDA